MTWVSVDIEADGPVPEMYSMISLGAIVVEPALNRTFYAELRPISPSWKPEALAASGFSREETLGFRPPKEVMREFRDWLDELGDRPRFVADNAGFDWGFVNYYFYYFTGSNPFGFSCLSLTSLYKGFERNLRANFKYLRKTKHSHNALDDAKGNAEAFLAIQAQGLRF